MRYVPIILAFALILPSIATAQEKINAGFVEGLWFSKEPVFAEEPVRIYAALRNNTGSDLTGTVTFKDGGAVVDTKEISALSGRLIETWADWTPSYGEHTISATLSNVRLHAVGEAPRSVTVTHDLSEQFIFVDRDTDGDGTGNKEDTDDDNDGVSDEEEEASGTDPLVSNAPENDAENTTDTTTQTDEQTENTEETTQPQEHDGSTDANTKSDQEGFEKYFDEGTVNAVLSDITERVDESKQRLDAYRDERAAQKKEAEEKEEAREDAAAADTPATTTDGEDATITRTQIQSGSGGFMATLVSGIAGIFDGLYTLLLWILSKTLSHPALVQFILLLTILVGAYKLAKWYGARRQMQ